MAKLRPVDPPYNPSLMQPVWGNPAFRARVNNEIEELAMREFPYLKNPHLNEAHCQLEAWGKGYVDWLAGKRVAPIRLTKAHRFSESACQEIREAVDKLLQVYLSELREVLAEVERVDTSLSVSALREIFESEEE